MVFMIRVAGERVGEIESLVVSRSKRYGDEVPHKIWVMYLRGIRMGTLSMLSERFQGWEISGGEVSRSKEGVKYLFIDGVYLKMGESEGMENVLILGGVGGGWVPVRIRVSIWREFFKGLKRGGL